MSDLAAFALVVATTVAAFKLSSSKSRKERSFFVNKDNELLLPNDPSADPSDEAVWHRATYILVMHDPPEMFYEPKEWNHTSVLLCRTLKDDGKTEELGLPSAVLNYDESYVHCAARTVLKQLAIDVSQPENSLHHLFTFPFEQHGMRRWSDFMECVYRGSLHELYRQGIPPDAFVRVSLADLKDMVLNSSLGDNGDKGPDDNGTNKESSSDEYDDITFTPDSYYAMRLYFQRQGDLRAKRRLMKGYSSTDLEHYQLRKENSKIVFLDDEDSARNQALDFTMQTDDGMSPHLLFEADLILLGVSRAGKTPLSLILSQTMGFKVANIPLVLDLPPPPQLFKVSPKRVFCLTMDEEQLKTFRRSRLRRELATKGMRKNKNSTYADTDYVRRDLEHAKRLAYQHGFTEINVSGRAIEETASLIASKIRERFPDTVIGTSS